MLLLQSDRHFYSSSVSSIGEAAFWGCTDLTGITIPGSVASIGEEAFDDCTSLISVIIPEGVTSIGEDAFCGCTSLTSVIIPESVTSIGSEAFPRSTCIYGYSGSAAETYYTSGPGRGRTFQVLHTHSYTSEITKAAAGTEAGTVTYTCSCGDSYTEDIPAAGHCYDSGNVTKKATTVSTGIKTYTCSVCGAVRTEIIAKTVLSTPEISSVTNVNGGITVKWGKVSGAEMYRVYRKTSSGSWKKLGDTASSSYTYTKVSSGTTYTFTVCCVSSDGKSTTSGRSENGKSIKYLSAGGVFCMRRGAKKISVFG